MAKSQAEQLERLDSRIDNLTLVVERLLTRSELQIEQLQEQLKDILASIRELNLSGSRLAERVAALEQRCAALEKLSDRGWGLGQAVIVSAISMIGGALLSLLIQSAIKK